MMKNRRFSIFIVIILCMVSFSDLKAQAPANDKASVKTFVQHFYDWYNVLQADDDFTRKHHLSPFAFAIKERGNYFDKPLRQAISDYFHKPLKSGETGLDFDPIAAAQDTRSGFQTGNVKQVGNTFRINLHDLPKGKSEKEILAAETFLVVVAVKVGKDWKLANFIYPAKGNMSQTDLIKLLAHQKKFGY
ncbi:hypothetical protein [Mucilaginibacter antarcticus]|uniref:DUF3828 domain-containing protein n=1 Tax=Mucilaginibacter antarcticus TaxID=1855725 RepID=A0ABW5XTY8_9SPHI